MTPQTHPGVGSPILRLRLAPETLEALRLAAGEPEHGRAGGVSLFVRRLIHEALALPMPRQHHADAEDLLEEPEPEAEAALRAIADDLEERALRLRTLAAALRRKRRRPRGARPSGGGA